MEKFSFESVPTRYYLLEKDLADFQLAFVDGIDQFDLSTTFQYPLHFPICATAVS